jgi:PAS domain S-box-containing protein
MGAGGELLSAVFRGIALPAVLARLPNGAIVEVSDAFERVFGYTREEARGRTSLELGINPDVGSRERILADLGAGRSVQDWETTLVTRSGERRAFSVSVGLVEVAGEKYVLCTTRDIADRKRAEEEVRRTNADLERRIAERTAELSRTNAELRAEIAERQRTEQEVQHLASFPRFNPNPVLEVDAAGTVTFRNQAAAEALTQMGLADATAFLPPDWAAIIQTFAHDPSLALEREVRVGSRLYEERIGYALGVGALRIYARDITEQRHAEAMAQAERQRLNDVLETLPAYLVLLTPDHRVIFANRFFRERFGEAQGRRCYEYLFRRTEPCEACETYRVLETGTPHRWQWTGPDGRHYDVHDFPIADCDGSPLILEVGLDVTEREQAEATLRESEDRWRSLFATSLDAVLLTAPDGHILAANAAACRMFGRTEEELIRVGRSGVVDSSDPRLQPALEERQRTGRFAGELTLLRSDGTRFPGEISSAVFHDRNGELRSSMVIRDITERKRTEEVAAARLRLLEYAPSHSLEDVLAATLDGLEGLTGSRIGFYHFLEPDQRTLSLQAWSTRTLRELCTAEGRGRHYGVDEAGVWVDCVRQRQPVIHNDYAALPHRRGLPPGHAPVSRELVVPIFRGGSIVAILGVGNKPTDYLPSDVELVSRFADLAWDIAERKRAESALRLSEERLRVGLNTASIAVFNQDLDLRYTWVLQPQLGYTAEQITGHTDGELLPAEAARQVTEVKRRVLKGGLREHAEVPVHVGGRTFIYDLVAEPLRDASGAIVGITGASLDITERKQAEEELRASREQMRALAARTQAAREEERTAVAREIHDVLAQELTRLKIDLAWLAGRLAKPGKSRSRDALVPRVAEMTGMADRAIHCVQGIATGLRPAVLDSLGLCAAIEWQARDFQDHARIPCEADVPAEELPVGRAAATAAFRILQESLTNVQRHARATRVSVRLRQDDRDLVLSVQDDGCGIAAGTLASPLSIGLAGMRERALLLGGQCDIRSQPGSGTCITVRLPV